MPSPGVESNPLGRQALTDQVYEELLASLVDGRHEPGDALSIDGVARELEVSPTPVREALARLEATGLVSRVAMRGYRVAPTLSAVELAELMDARLAIEPVTALRACKRATPALLDALDRSIADLRNAPTGSLSAQYRDYWQADRRFHDLIAESADNRFLLMAYNCWAARCNDSGCSPDWESPTPRTPSRSTRRFWTPSRRGSKKARKAMIKHIAGVRARSIKDVVDQG